MIPYDDFKDTLITKKEAQKLIPISDKQFWRLVRIGKIKKKEYKKGHFHFYKDTVLEAYFSETLFPHIYSKVSCVAQKKKGARDE